MPPRIKLILSGLVLIAAVIVHFFQSSIGQDVNKWIVLALGAFMILSIWLFPEAGKRHR
jgi:accessory gene regulator protein AgrB